MPAKGTAESRNASCELAEALTSACGLAEALPVAVEELCRRTGWPLGHALLLTEPPAGDSTDDANRIWVVEKTRQLGDFQKLSDRYEDQLRSGIRKNDDWLARVIASATPVWEESLAGLTVERRQAASQAGLEAGCAFPVQADGEVVAVVELLRGDAGSVSRAVRELVESTRHTLDMVAACERARRAVRTAALKVRRLHSDLARAGSALQRADEGYSLIRQVANDGLWEWDPRRNQAKFSARWKEILGLSSADLGEGISEWLDRVHPEDRERVGLEFRDYLEKGGTSFESRHKVTHPDGTDRWVMVRALALRNEKNQVVRVAGSLTDVSEMKTLEERSFQNLLYHPITGFPRASLFMDRLQHAIRRRNRKPDGTVALLAIELDGLEGTARGLGSQAREELLMSVGRRLSAALRPGDSVGHAADFPFAVLLEEVEGGEGALGVAQRIRADLTRPVLLEETEVQLSPFIGIALHHAGYEKPKMLLLDAALALRRARKRATGIQLFDEETRMAATAVAELEGDLRAAFTHDEFSLDYQPIVSLDDGRITGLEAYLRWRHPTKGMVAPDHFLPVAEEAELIEEIGYWVLNRACQQIKEWDKRLTPDSPPTLAVNISERQFYDPNLISTTTGILKATSLDFRRLRFDVAEGVFMKDPSRATRVLTALKARGIRVAIDDFGSGYSSISLLHRFSVSSLKIDRWFISGQTAKLRGWDVAQTIVELAKILGLEVIAEGVESREQFQRLRNLGCHQAQGYFFSPAVPPEKAEELIRDGYPLDLAAPTR